MKCPKCQFDNTEGSKFCGGCGSSLDLEVICPNCGSKPPQGYKFCNECGHNLTGALESPRQDLSFDEKIAKIQRYLPEGLTEKILSQKDRIEGERKQVTVLFTDMEGFTSLTDRLGPEEAYSIMGQVYEILIHKVHDYEGTVNEMTGDGIVALFGAPIALEDAPQRAIRSAMAIHREMTRFSERMREDKRGIPPLKMRVGIHTGPVVVGTLGNDLRVEFKAVGDTVNLASRMEELAEPGTTYVTEETFKLTEGLFRYEALGGKEIKGKEESVNVYQVIAPSTRRTRFDVSAERGLTPFVGRDRELEILLDGFQEVKAGRGQAFSIVSEAGVGKSRLLYEFRKAVANEDVTFLEGKSLSYSTGVVYHPVIDILKSNFDIREDEGVPQIIEKVRQGLRILGADEAGTLPYLLELLSVEEDEAEKTPISPETRKERIIESLKTIVLGGAEIRPLIMAFEDLHWVDKSSEDVLKTFLEISPGARLLLIFTYRPEYVHTWGGKSYHSQLNLNRLSNREALAMVTHLLATGDIQKDLAELILQKTEGIPFFIEEFVRSLREQRIIERTDARYHLAKNVQEVTIPSTVQDVIMARIDSLPEGAKETLQTGSVIDREFGYELINRVAGLPEQELMARLSVLRDSELLYERGMYPHTTYIFKHALTQEVAYNSLLVKRRKEIHENIGESIEVLYSERLEEYYELLAYHFIRSDNKVKAVDYLYLANQKAARIYAMEDAKSYFDEAMKLLDTLPDTEKNRERRLSLLVNQDQVYYLLLRMPEYYELLMRYETLLDDLTSPKLVAAYYTRLGYCEQQVGFLDRAIKSSTKAAELSESAGNMEDAAYAYHVLVWSHMLRSEFDRAFAYKEKVFRTLDKKLNFVVLVRTLTAASAGCIFLGRWDSAVEHGKEALLLAKRSSDKSLITQATYILSMAYSFMGESKLAIEHAELAVKIAPSAGIKQWSRMFSGGAWCRFGEPKKGIETLVSILPDLRARIFAGEIVAMYYLAEGYLIAGDLAKASETAEDLLELADPRGVRFHSGYAQRVLAEVALKTTPDEAVPHFEKAISIFKKIKAENELALAYSGMGRYHKQQGNTEQAREYLSKALEIFERLGTLLEPDKVREELDDLPQ